MKLSDRHNKFTKKTWQIKLIWVIIKTEHEGPSYSFRHGEDLNVKKQNLYIRKRLKGQTLENVFLFLFNRGGCSGGGRG